jgi:hypothetical protein
MAGYMELIVPCTFFQNHQPCGPGLTGAVIFERALIGYGSPINCSISARSAAVGRPGGVIPRRCSERS